jgi:hypothetical protein
VAAAGFDAAGGNTGFFSGSRRRVNDQLGIG